MAKLRANVGQRMDPETQEFRAKVDEFIALQFDRFILEPIRAMARVGGELKWAAGLGPEPKERATLLDVFEATGTGVGAGAPGGGTGPANVLRKDALKQLRNVERLAKKYGVQTDPRFFPGMERGLRVLPQKELDRVEKLRYKENLGRALGTWDMNTGEVRILTSGYKPEETLFHEVGHARALPGIPYLRTKKSIPEYKPPRLRRYAESRGLLKSPTRAELRTQRGTEGFAEQMISIINDMGAHLAEQNRKRFYWKNPTEILAREVERRVALASDLYKIPDPRKYQLVKGGKLPEAEYERISAQRKSVAEGLGLTLERYTKQFGAIEEFDFILDRATKEVVAGGREKADAYYNFLRNNQDYIQAPIPDKAYDEVYRKALETTLREVKTTAPKVYRKAYEETKRRFEDIRNLPPES